MRVWDVFTYWRERWAVDARRLLWSGPLIGPAYVPMALLGDRTHRGDPLPADLPDPGVRSVWTVLDADGDWGREAQQRDAVHDLLADMDPNDLVLLCDADEFVDPAALPAILAATEQGPVKLRMAHYMAGTRWRHASWWRHAGACRAKDLPERPTDELRMRFDLPRVADAGWHVTYFGSDADVDAKLAAFAHAEVDNEQTRREVAHIRATGAGFIDDPMTGALADILSAVAV